MRLATLMLLALLPVAANAAELRISCTAPTMQADSLCNVTTLPQDTTMTIRFRWSGPRAGEDSVVAVPPGASVVRTYQVPSGYYTITGDARDNGGGGWSCPVTITKRVRGRPDRVQIGDALLWHPPLLALR